MRDNFSENSKMILCVSGARPNFMKLAPIMHALLDDNSMLCPILVHTGQHYDDVMAGNFIRDLGLPDPAYSLGVGGGSHAQQTAEIMKRFEPIVENEGPDAVLVVGDVNSTAACAMVAAKLQIPVIHAEAGLRSFDRSMPEEINRIVTDAISSLFLVSEASGVENLRREGIRDADIFLVGSLMIDSLLGHLNRARAAGTAERLNVLRPYGVVTLHRPSNVDNTEQLLDLLAGLRMISNDLVLVFPVHPRTRNRLTNVGFDPGGRFLLTEPLGYCDFLGLLAGSSAVFTDSGGIQEETTVLGIPCYTLRANTERPATIIEGTNVLAGTSGKELLGAWSSRKSKAAEKRVPNLWDGKAAQRCRDAIREWFGLSSLDSGRTATQMTSE